MIIKLTGADFSAKNIGTISIPFEIDADIQQILSHYTRSLTDKQKYYFQLFYRGLQSSRLLGKIKNLYLPILANSVNEAMFNIVAGNIDATNVENSLYTMNPDNALYCTKTDKTEVANPLTFPYSASTKNMHLMMYLASDTSIIASSSLHLFGSGKTSSDIVQMYYEGTSSGSGAVLKLNIYGSGEILGIESGLTIGKGAKIVSVGSDTNVLFSADKKTKSTNASSTITADTKFTKDVMPFLAYSKKAVFVTPAYAMSAGSSLTADDMATYNTLLDTFINAIAMGTLSR